MFHSVVVVALLGKARMCVMAVGSLIDSAFAGHKGMEIGYEERL